MKKLNFIAILILAIGISCSGQANNVLAPKDFKSKMKQPGVILVDVRTPEEFKAVHLVNAVNINVNDSGFEAQSSKLDKAKVVLVYCKVVKRSKKAADLLRQKGYKVHELGGGLQEWESAGLPVVKEKK